LKILGEKGIWRRSNTPRKPPKDPEKADQKRSGEKLINGNTKTHEKHIRILAKISVIKNNQLSMENIERNAGEEMKIPRNKIPKINRSK
jgi:hypothetical protein